MHIPSTSLRDACAFCQREADIRSKNKALLREQSDTQSRICAYLPRAEEKGVSADDDDAALAGGNMKTGSLRWLITGVLDAEPGSLVAA